MGVNKVLLLGNLGKDPEVRYTPNQTAVCTFTLATGERRKDQSGNWVEHTEWHTVVVFGKTAENCGNYLKKGRQAFVEGRIQTRKWQDKEGRDRYTTEIIASNVQFVGGKGDSSGYSEARSSEARPMAANGGPAPSRGADSHDAPPTDDISFDDDDIPF